MIVREQEVAFRLYEAPVTAENLTRDLVSYAGEYFHRLAVTGYKVKLSEFPQLFKDEETVRGQAEKEMAQNLAARLAQKPVGTRVLLQSPRQDAVGYFSEVWYAGILVSPDTLEMFDIRVNLAADSPPLPLGFYTEIHNRLSPDGQLSQTATTHDIVRHPLILRPSPDGIFPILETMAEVLNQDEVIFDLEKLKQDIKNRAWEEVHQNIEKKVTADLLAGLAGSILARSETNFYRNILLFEQIMAAQTGNMPRGSCGLACQLAARFKTNQPYLSKGPVEVSTSFSEAARCEKCKKIVARCDCQKA